MPADQIQTPTQDEPDHLPPLQVFQEEIAADRDRVRAAAAGVRAEIEQALQGLQDASDPKPAISVALRSLSFLLDEQVESATEFLTDLSRLVRLNLEQLRAASDYALDVLESEEEEDGERGDYDEDDDEDEASESALMPADAGMIVGMLTEYLHMLTAGVSEQEPGTAARQMVEARLQQLQGLITRVHQITISG